MSYALGVDIGTTFSAAAVYRQGRAEMVSLGYHSALVPSAVLITSANETLVGDAALRRGQSEPERLARFFKRRIGDSVPMILGGSPLSAETLTARLLRAVVDRVVEQQGERPSQVAVTRPANWGPFKQDRFDQAVRLADLQDVTVLTEPEAAALAYAAEQRIAPDAVVAVYDLGGGTFDATVLRRTGDRFSVVGEPEGIERLGGIDFDAAVFEHVRQSLYGAIEALDEDDPVTLRSITRLRNECIEAKEALSSDTQVTIPVVLPGMNTEVRLTRSELEGMIRPALDDSIAALRRAVTSAGVEPADLDRVLLVGQTWFETAHELPLLEEASFTGPEVEKVLAGIQKISDLEWEADKQQAEMSREVIRNEAEMGAVSVMFWMNILRELGTIANKAENTADLLRLMLAKR
mgnify:CR=1 FL=1